MNMSTKRKQPNSLIKRSVIAVAVSLCFTQGAYAVSFSPSKGLKIDWDTTLTYGASWRVERLVDPTINPANFNKDDGDRNFDKGLISNRISITTEMDLNYQNDFGVFLRARAYYDDVYHHSNDHD